MIEMLDITRPSVGVQIVVSEDRKTMWVNVDDHCVLRVQQIPRLEIEPPTLTPGGRA